MTDTENDASAIEKAEPKSGRITLDFQMHFAQPSRRLLVREGPAPLPPASRGSPPRVARMLAQAHLFQRMLEAGQAADLARRFKLTRARVTQISNYTLLAPDIQEEVLAMPPIEPGREPIREPGNVPDLPAADGERMQDHVVHNEGPNPKLSTRSMAC